MTNTTVSLGINFAAYSLLANPSPWPEKKICDKSWWLLYNVDKHLPTQLKVVNFQFKVSLAQLLLQGLQPWYRLTPSSSFTSFIRVQPQTQQFAQQFLGSALKSCRYL